MKKYTVSVTQKFTDEGRRGVWMFMLAPIVEGIAWYWYTSMAFYNASVLFPAILMLLSGLAFLGGIVFMLVGRTQQHIVFDETATKDGDFSNFKKRAA